MGFFLLNNILRPQEVIPIEVEFMEEQELKDVPLADERKQRAKERDHRQQQVTGSAASCSVGSLSNNGRTPKAPSAATPAPQQQLQSDVEQLLEF
ncbi:hypothetical protein Cadr_000025697 [Camelus dromedarius]|uniref:Uncharacterized protein n=1 Tax=Camelus dromedarius TaxID=9838 RepID=A0A5N4CLY3_CAMDR|nr:hypothetical protein Cadr_000025697 [Camelus dromedarius]